MQKIIAPLILVLLFSFFSCTSQERERLQLLKESKTVNYHLKIFKLASKFDKNGVAQCSKYESIRIDTNLFYSYGLKLRGLLAFSYNVDKKYLSNLPHDSLNNFYLKIEINNLTNDKLNYYSIINESLLNLFDLTVEEEIKTIKGYVFLPINEKKLNSFISNDTLSGTISCEGNKYTASAIKLSTLSKIYDRRLDNFIYYSGLDNNNYSIDFPIYKDMTKANEYFKQYGLSLKKSTFKRTFYEIKTTVNTN